MTLSNLYAHAQSTPELYNTLLGIAQDVFENLTRCFDLGIPQRFTKNERLFATLYAGHNALDAKATGELLQYTNQKRDGDKFIYAANKALARARKIINTTTTPAQIIPLLQLPIVANMPARVKKIPVFVAALEAPVLISYRNDQGKTMHGAFYDHYTIRNITQRETYITKAPDHQLDSFTYFITDTAVNTLGIKASQGERIIPEEEKHKNETCGLLVIPGHASSDKDSDREKHEQSLIKKARMTGQPILAICAGSWRLWQGFGGTTKAVSGHLYTRMPSIISNGGIGYNTQIHRIELQSDTVVAGAMHLNKSIMHQKPTVNSVHWQVADIASLPKDTLQISALAAADNSLTPTNRNGPMTPESKEIEAFETKHGAPMIGIQWHPEAYYKNKEFNENGAEYHLNLITYMAKAGDAYQARKQTVAEFNKITRLLEKQGLFKQTANNNVVRPSLIKEPLQELGQINVEIN